MKALVTGATGFIGKLLCKKLVEEGHTVYGVDIQKHEELVPEVKYIKSDITNPKELKELDFDTIFHLAALPSIWYGQLHPAEVFHINVGGTIQMLELAKEKKAKLILPSSIALYAGDKERFKEEDVNLTSFLAASKHVGEIYCKQYHDAFDIKSVILRFAYVYGPGSRGPVSDIQKGGPLYMHSDSLLDFVHIKDVISALLKAATHDKFGIYNIGSGKGTSIKQLLAMMKSDVVPKNERPPKKLVLDTTHTKQEFGWEPTIKLEDGLCDI